MHMLPIPHNPALWVRHSRQYRYWVTCECFLPFAIRRRLWVKQSEPSTRILGKVLALPNLGRITLRVGLQATLRYTNSPEQMEIAITAPAWAPIIARPPYPAP